MIAVHTAVKEGKSVTASLFWFLAWMQTSLSAFKPGSANAKALVAEAEVVLSALAEKLEEIQAAQAALNSSTSTTTTSKP
jgi:chlorite dismutase